MSPSLLLWLGLSMVVFVAASTVLRTYAGGGASWLLVGALVLYTLGNLMMVRLMRESGLAVAVSVSAVLQLVLMAGVAALLFGERPTGQQWAGIGLGVVAVALIAWPRAAP